MKPWWDELDNSREGLWHFGMEKSPGEEEESPGEEEDSSEEDSSEGWLDTQKVAH